MKLAVLACLLVVAGASAFPQDVDVAPSQARGADLWLKGAITRLRRRIVESGLDPLKVEKHKIDYSLFDGLVELVGEVVDLRFKGASRIYWNFINYNILLGRLDWDIVMPEVSLSAGKFEVEGRYGDRGGRVELSGSGVVTDIRLRGNALLRLDPGPQVTIYNINVDFSIGNIEAEVKAKWQCRGCDKPEDYSETVNDFFNRILKELLLTYKYELDTILAEIIRYLVNWYW